MQCSFAYASGSAIFALLMTIHRLTINKQNWGKIMKSPSVVLIADDDVGVRNTLQKFLAQEGYILAFSVDGPSALVKAEELCPDVILLDVMMPGMDGFEVTRRLRSIPKLADVPILIVTTLDDSESRVKGLEAGADDYITKPIERIELRARLRTITRLNRYRRIQNALQELQDSYEATLRGWVFALDLRDKETEGHSQRVTQLTVELARAMKLPETEIAHIRRGALLHDIGKIGIPDAILHKPDRLTEQEFAVIKRHPDYANEMLRDVVFLQPALDIPYCHHEKFDGSGYPRGLKGEEIPLAARMFAVVDVWDALRSDRPYRPSWPASKVRSYIRENEGSHFDPTVAEIFLAMPSIQDQPG